MKRLFALLTIVSLGLFVTGCPGQVPAPSPSPTVPLTCTPPAGFTPGAGSGFIWARAVCASSSSCPVNGSGNTAFVQLNITPTATCAFTDATPPVSASGTLVIYTASAVQVDSNGKPITGQPSLPSNNGVPTIISARPGQPSAPNSPVTSAELAPPVVRPALPLPVDPGIGSPSAVIARVEYR